MSALRLPPESRETLHARAFNVHPEALAASLYGPAWREAVHQTATGWWRTSRDPLPTFLADFLGDVLRDVVAHDGRSTRESRAGGWWRRSSSGVWSPTSVEGVAAMLHADLSEILAEALADAERVRAEARRAPDGAPIHGQVRAASIRAAVLSGLSHVVASIGKHLSGALRILRERSALTMPADALRAVASSWLDDALDRGDLTPVRGRLLVADVKALHDDQTRSGEAVLPLLALYRALDDLLGPRLRRIEWPLTDASATEEPAA
jgi:hypothetical protein